MKISDLKFDPKNANKGTDRGRKALADSLKQYGAGRSILVDKKGNVIAGNKTLEQAIAAGHKDILVVKTDGTTLVAVQRIDLDLKDKRTKALAIADNRVAELDLEWDAEVLSELVGEIDLSSLWSPGELEKLLGPQGDQDAPEPQLDKAAELQKKWKTKRGQLWLIGEHRLLVGDSTKKEDVARLWGKGRADAVLCDPPYGINRAGIANDDPEGLQGLFNGVIAAIPIDNGVIVAFQSPRLFWVWLDEARSAGQKFERMLWLDKVNDETFPWRGWLMKSEAIVLTSVGKPHWNDVHPYAHDSYRVTTVGQELPKSWGKVHASVKPLEVVKDLAQRICKDGDALYDPFLGSGTSTVAAQLTGRKCYGIELDPSHVAVALERLSDMGLKPKLAA